MSSKAYKEVLELRPAIRRPSKKTAAPNPHSSNPPSSNAQSPDTTPKIDSEGPWLPGLRHQRKRRKRSIKALVPSSDSDDEKSRKRSKEATESSESEDEDASRKTRMEAWVAEYTKKVKRCEEEGWEPVQPYYSAPDGWRSAWEEVMGNTGLSVVGEANKEGPVAGGSKNHAPKTKPPSIAIAAPTPERGTGLPRLLVESPTSFAQPDDAAPGLANAGDPVIIDGVDCLPLPAASASTSRPIRAVKAAKLRPNHTDPLPRKLPVASPSTLLMVPVKGPKGKGKRGKAKSLLEYKDLDKKSQQNLNSVSALVEWMDNLAAAKAEASASSSSSTSTSSKASLRKQFEGIKLLFLPYAAKTGALTPRDRLTLVKLAKLGVHLETSLQLGSTTHVLACEQTEAMNYRRCLDDLDAQLSGDKAAKARLRSLINGPDGGVLGSETLYLLSFHWVVNNFKEAATEPKDPRYYRIKPRKSKSSISKPVASTSVLDGFIGPRNNQFNLLDDSGGSQITEQISSDYYDGASVRVAPATDLGDPRKKGMKPLVVSAAAPGHRALRRELGGIGFNDATVEEEDIEGNSTVHSGLSGASDKGKGKADGGRGVRDEGVLSGLEDEIECARMGQGREPGDEEIDDNYIFDATEGHYSTDECNSGDEEYLEAEEAKFKARKKESERGSKYRCDQTGTSKTNGPNEDICVALEKLANLYQSALNDTFRTLSIRKAMGVLRSSTERLDTYDKLVALRGIGGPTALKIVEIARTGTHRRLKHRTDRDRVRDLFEGIYGVGKKTADKWYDRGLRTLDDVRRGKSGLVLSAAQKIGLKYYDDLQEKMPRKEVEDIFAHVESIAKSVDPKLQVQVMGSFRRGAATCGDIDIIVTRNAEDGLDERSRVQDLIDSLCKAGIVTYRLSEPDDWSLVDAKFMGLCSLGKGHKQRRIDVLGVPFEELGAALIYFTGNDIFNRSLRLKARHMGYNLNQKGLYKDVLREKAAGSTKVTEGIRIASRTEQEIFSILGVKWAPPEKRNV